MMYDEYPNSECDRCGAQNVTCYGQGGPDEEDVIGFCEECDGKVGVSKVHPSDGIPKCLRDDDC